MDDLETRWECFERFCDEYEVFALCVAYGSFAFSLLAVGVIAAVNIAFTTSVYCQLP